MFRDFFTAKHWWENEDSYEILNSTKLSFLMQIGHHKEYLRLFECSLKSLIFANDLFTLNRLENLLSIKNVFAKIVNYFWTMYEKFIKYFSWSIVQNLHESFESIFLRPKHRSQFKLVCIKKIQVYQKKTTNLKKNWPGIKVLNAEPTFS